MKTKLKKPIAKPNELKIQYGQEFGNRPELFYCWGEGIPKSHSLMLLHFFNEIKNTEGKTLLQELDKLGYDLSSLKFSIVKTIDK